MPRVIFMCGPAGSGKSTVVRRLEAAGWVRLSFDLEAWARGHRITPLPDQVQGDIDRCLCLQLVALLESGHDVVLDFYFWSRQMRDEWRRVLAPLGVIPETIYVATDRSVVLTRLRARSGAHGDDFHIAPDVAASFLDRFEPLTVAEGPVTVIG